MTEGLNSLGGEPPPPDLEADLRSWLVLSHQVRENFWELLLPNLAPEVDDRITARVQSLMHKYEVTAEEIGPPIKACRNLMRTAARLDVSVDDLSEDALRLVPDEPQLVANLRAWYERARPHLRREMIMGTLSEHGRFATAVDWRIDHITRSKRAKAINASVAVMTFRYREGNEDKRFTLQLMPELVAELGRACGEILSE